MEEETKIQRFERLMQEKGIKKWGTYNYPEETQLYEFFVAVEKNCPKQETNRPTPTPLIAKYAGKAKPITKPKLNKAMQLILNRLKNRKVFGLSPNELSNLEDISLSATYDALRRLQSLELIQKDKNKKWITK